MLVNIMSKQNIVVSGRYFSGIWKCFAYPWFLIIGAILSLFVIPPLGGLLYVLGIFGFFAGKIGTTFYLHADAVNLKEAHGVKKGVWPYIIAFWFFGYLVVVIYHSSRSALIRRAGLVEESIEGRRIWSYDKQNSVPYYEGEEDDEDDEDGGGSWGTRNVRNR